MVRFPHKKYAPWWKKRFKSENIAWGLAQQVMR